MSGPGSPGGSSRRGDGRRGQLIALHRALDEARFGAERTLNLRSMLPTADQAATRAESWLRERQVSQAGEVLIITGRGNASADGVSVVRETIVRLLASLRRRGVVAGVREHTPGSFVVDLAPVSALRGAPRRTREPVRSAPADPAELQALSIETLRALRRLALHALEALGAREPEPFVHGEMLAQFQAVVGGVPPGGDRDRRLREAIYAAIAEYENAG